jgi:ELWxxDGT repeat protein
LTRKSLAAFALIAALSIPLGAQAPYLVTDLNTVSKSLFSSFPQQFQTIGSRVSFNAHDGHLREVWMYSGGTVSRLVEEANQDRPMSLGLLHDLGNGTWLFRATSPMGVALWRTDGTSAGTSIVEELYPNVSNFTANLGVVYKNKFYFPWNDGVNGIELWVSDGTANGTYMLVNLNGTSASSTFRQLSVLGDKLLIFANDRLWTSDGTAAGTVETATVGDVRGEARIGSTLFFGAFNAATGRELWKTDGTTAGTQLVADIAPGATASLTVPTAMAVIGTTLYFSASDGTGTDLWKSDGTAAGTQQVRELTPNRAWASAMHAVGTTLYIASGTDLWRSDGTFAGTTLADTGVYGLAPAFGRAYYFRWTDAATELWAVDNGVKSRVVVLPQANADNRPRELTYAGGKLFFGAWDADSGVELWISDDGTAATTRRLANLSDDIPASSHPNQLAASGSLVYFKASDGISGTQVWRSDGTSNGTIRLTTIPGTSGELDVLTVWRNALFFKAPFAQLWRSDGTAAGTSMLKNLEGFNTPSITKMFPGSGHLFLSADGGPGPRVWTSDGTGDGTVPLGPHDLDYPIGYTEVAGRVYITAGLHNPGVWVTDGSAASTKRLTSVEYGALDEAPAAAAGFIFYTNETGDYGRELWRTDGYVGTGALLKDIAPGADSSSPAQLTGAGRYVYFVANDGTSGNELWRSDGTAAGTILLKNIRAGAGNADIQNLTVAGPLVYFTANDGVNGVELWRTDGTTAGTVIVANIAPGSASSTPQWLRFLGGSLWFAANDGTNGEELWRLTGDTLTMVADLAPGAASSRPREMVLSGQLLYFTATSGLFGNELWAMQLSGSVLRIDDVRITEGSSGTRTARFTVTRLGNTSGAASAAFATANGTATAGADYVATTGTVSFTAGQTSRFIDVTVNSDSVIENNEAFQVLLSSPAGAVLEKSVGTGIIEDDDRRAELSIAPIQVVGSERMFRITNAGPSAATEVTVRFSQSPGEYQIRLGDCWSETNPATCNTDSLAAGETRDITFELIARSAFMRAPGFTATASVRAAELDSNPADNVSSRVFSTRGEIMLPPSINTGSTATLVFMKEYLPSARFVRFTSSTPNVVITPASMTIPAGQATASFTVTTGTQSGVAEIVAYGEQDAWIATMKIGVVAPGTAAKLDSAIVTENSSVLFGEPGTVGVRISARRHDGTLPTGLVSLLDAQWQVVAQQSLGANGSTVFTRNGLQPGNTEYYVKYHGDANFNPIEYANAWIHVSHFPTEIAFDLPPVMCAGGTYPLLFVVRNTANAQVPTGSIEVSLNDSVIATVPLSASGIAGESRATYNFVPPASSLLYMSVRYVPSGTFQEEIAGSHSSAASCIALNARATATSASSVHVTWNASGAHHYDVVQYHGGGSGGLLLGETTGTSYTDATWVSGNNAYLYVVRAFDAAGNFLGMSAPDLAVTILFTDDPLRARQTAVKAQHLRELRGAALALRNFRFNADNTSSTPVSGTAIKATDVTSLRTEINFYRQLLGLPAMAWTDPALARGTSIKAVHFQELRNAVK